MPFAFDTDINSADSRFLSRPTESFEREYMQRSVLDERDEYDEALLKEIERRHQFDESLLSYIDELDTEIAFASDEDDEEFDLMSDELEDEFD